MTGRPRKRTRSELLQGATELFWRRGYDGTSVGELSEALGVGPSSLYRTFGSKEDLYRTCLMAYAEQEGAFIRRGLGDRDVLRGLRSILREAPAIYTRPDRPAGCAVLAAPGAHRPESEDVEAFLRELRRATFELIRASVVRGVDEGQLAPATDAAAVARFVLGTLQTLSMQARDGASEAELAAVVEVALRALGVAELAVGLSDPG